MGHYWKNLKTIIFTLLGLVMMMNLSIAWCADTVSLYRLYNSKSGDHFYTTSVAEGGGANSSAAKGGYTYEGVAGYIYSTQQTGTVPLYRLYNKKSGDHFYTISAAEGGGANSSAAKGGYIYEGVTGYIFSSQSIAACAAPAFGDSKKNTSVYVASCYSQLALQHSGCTQSNAFSDACNAAISRTCQANGYVSGYGPVEHSGDAVHFVCVNSSAASYVQGTYSKLKIQHSGCTQSSPFGDSCNAAISRSCQASGYVSGFGPVEHSGDAANYVCVNSSAASYVQGNYSKLLTIKHSGCTQSAAFSDSCNAAISRTCSASGNVSGFGPVEHSSDAANYVCMKPLSDKTLVQSFFWGTESYPDKISQVKDIINKTLKIVYVKQRLQMPMVTKDGKTFTAKACLPSQLTCSKQNDLDEAAKLFKENNWSMVPMLSHDISDKNIDAADIDNFAEFVDWFVSRYKNDANIKYIELINSPASWWVGTDKQLVDLMNKVYDRIKNKYPDIMIGTPGFEYWNDVKSEAGVLQLEYFLDKTNGAKFDFLAFHGYPLTIIGNDSTGYPPTSKAMYNELAGIYGLLEIRKRLDANGWGNRMIIDTEHTGLFATKQNWSEKEYLVDAAFMVQELLIKKTLQLDNKSILSGIIPFKIAPRGETGEFAFASLKSDGAITPAIKAAGILLGKFNGYNYLSRLSGNWDAENTPWIEKFTSGSDKELYIFFKPFKYVIGKSLSLDNETLKYTLNLSKTPKSITLTDIEGNVSSVAASKTVTLEVVNSPKYLEIAY